MNVNVISPFLHNVNRARQRRDENAKSRLTKAVESYEYDGLRHVIIESSDYKGVYSPGQERNRLKNITNCKYIFFPMLT